MPKISAAEPSAILRNSVELPVQSQLVHSALRFMVELDPAGVTEPSVVPVAVFAGVRAQRSVAVIYIARC